MRPTARRSFLTFTLILSLSLTTNPASASSFIIDDADPSSLRWNGGWTGFTDQPAPTWDRTLTWSNISDSTVTCTFTGTSVQVFGALKPVGTWSMQSQYALDGGAPSTFLPPEDVPAEAYNQSFYSSGTLQRGEHTLTITNLGAQLWLDYFLVGDDGGEGAGGSTFTSPGGVKERTSTTTTTTATATATVMVPAAKSTTASPSVTSSTTVGTTTATTTSTSSLPTPTNSDSSSVFTTSQSTTTTIPSSAPLPSSAPTSSLNGTVTAPPRGAGATQAPAAGTSNRARTGLIAGVTLGGIAVLAILLALGIWARRRRTSSLIHGIAPYPFRGLASGQDTPNRPDASFRESQYSATLLHSPRLSRPISSFTDLVESYAERSDDTRTYRRSRDGGVTIAGGPGVDTGDAPSVSEARSVKSRLPPVYQSYGHGAA